MAQENAIKTLAVVGGGRWAQVTLSVLVKMKLPFQRIMIVSKINAHAVNNFIQTIRQQSNLLFEVVDCLQDLEQYAIDAAIVVNALDKHFLTAQYFLKRSIPILLEKPLVTSRNEVLILLDNAREQSVNFIPGLCYRFCSYIKNFAEQISKKDSPKKFAFEWYDAADELRYGQIKRYDHSISVLQDILPHVWTILMQVFQNPKIEILNGINQPNQGVLWVALGHCRGLILVNRHYHQRKRHLAVEFEHGGLALDFTQEPGTIYAGSNISTYSADTQWTTRASPLTQQLAYFFAAIDNQQINQADLEDSLASVTFTELALSKAATQIGNIKYAVKQVD